MMRTVRTSQPQTPVGIDWGNPITRGLVFAATPNGPDSVTGTQAAKIGGGSISAYAKGKSFKSSSNTADGWYWALPSSASLYKISSSYTILVVANNTSSASFGNLLGVPFYGGSWSPPYYAFALSSTDPTTTGVLNNSNGGATNNALSSAGFWTSTANSYAATRAGDAARFFRDGQSTSNTSLGSSSPVNFNTNQPVCLFNRSNSSVGEGKSGDAALALIFNRALSDAEIKSLSDNPWQIFQPTNRAIWTGYEAPAGGSPYTLTAEAGAVAIAGTVTGLAFNRTLVADAASLAVNGTATGLAFNRRLTADTTSLAVTGNPATLTYTPIGGPTYTLTADTANTAITGADAGLAFNRRLIADTANTPIAGTDAGLARGYTLAADTTALGISGSDAALIAVRKLVADAYALAVAGADATLTYTPLSLPTIGRPASDTSNTGWTASTGSDLYAMIDEVTPSDADYISASSVGAVCKMALGTTAYPGSASQVLKYRASSSTGNSVIVRLKEGATTIRAETQLLTSVDTEYSITLTSGEIAAITSGSLSVELESA